MTHEYSKNLGTRLGRFTCTVEFLQDAKLAGLTELMFKDLIVVKAESVRERNLINYVAVSDNFEEMGPDGEIPRYTWEALKNEVDGEVVHESKWHLK